MSDDGPVIAWYEPHAHPVEAFRYDGSFPLEFLRNGERVSASLVKGDCEVRGPGFWVTIKVGAWVVRGEDGRVYPYEPDRFAASYRLVTA